MRDELGVVEGVGDGGLGDFDRVCVNEVEGDTEAVEVRVVVDDDVPVEDADALEDADAELEDVDEREDDDV